ncbi:MAG: InlB B-repeat-containing protein, partial [Acholeplasmataceae bacterium]|nr:InlB B-repeat-containing protein [Acholeplasmataceae bacterium]
MNLLKKVAGFIIAVVLVGVLGAGTYYVFDNIQSGSSLEETADNVKIDYQQGDSNRRVTQNLGLANSVNGVEVVWTSSDTSVISIQGNVGVVNDVEEAKHVTLTATIKNGSKEKVKEFVVTVVKKHYNVVFDGFEQFNIKVPFNGVVTNVPTPIKDGFTFKHWSLETNGVSFDFSNKIVKDTTFYAVFDQNNTEATYKVEHYYENLTNNGYTLKVEKSETGTISTLTRAVSIPSDGFIKINHPNSVEVGEIKADGSLVLRVYYQLVRKNVSFDLQGGSGNIPSQAIKVGSKVITP